MWSWFYWRQRHNGFSDGWECVIRYLENRKACLALWLYISCPSGGDTCLSYQSCLFSMFHPSLQPECPSVGISCSAQRSRIGSQKLSHPQRNWAELHQIWKDKARSSPFQSTDKEPVPLEDRGVRSKSLEAEMKRLQTQIGLRHSFSPPSDEHKHKIRIVSTLYNSQ